MVTTEEFQTEFISVACKYGLPTKRLSYGTAGFRDQYTILHSTFVRMGILASLRSLQLNNSYTNNVGKSINYSNNYSVGKQIVVGLMITASHNAEIDNGIKLVDSDGGMLAQSWEPYAELLANSTNNTIYDSFLEIIKKKNIDISTVINRIANSNSNSMKPLVLIGRDTRPHSYEMAQCVREGVELFGNYSLFDLGEVTTPQLHYIVDYINSSSVDKEFNRELLLSIYYESLCNGYTELISTAPIAPLHLVVDASFGVGSIALEKVCEQLETLRCNSLTIDIRNKAYAGKVNDNCGAELVQKNQVPPCGLSKDTDGNKLMCSFDGDGDRIVFHAFVSNNNQESWILLDGDKIAAIFALLISQELEAAELASYNFSVGVVQTAYANVASTSYLNRKNIKTVIAKTGVKYVEHKALEYDVGIYFEANGHGTVKFSRNFIDIIANLSADIGKEKENRRSTAIFRLKATLKAINQAVGDAVSDMLYTVAALQVLGIGYMDWHNMYTDLPSKQQKVPVPDKNMVSCTEDETMILTPAGMQADLDKAMKSVSKGRCFVRPSGTEDVVRIYAEAASTAEAEQLAKLAYDAIIKHLGTR